MAKKAYAVIGAGYGDEGKGLMTDKLAHDNQVSCVVRSNGGAQAGHTVITPDGRRHVFSHIGSGAFAGVPTHLSSHFVLHPMFFIKEKDQVADLQGCVTVSADPRAVVTTPFDILINHIVEDHRGLARHGSCGMGFGETIERNLNADVAISFQDLLGSRLGLISKLERIRREWVGRRLQTLGVEVIPERFEAILNADEVVRRFLEDCEAFTDTVNLKLDSELPDNLLFEGAQGLLLDQDYGAFPHVTRSNTGIRNMASISKEAGIDSINATYVTRAYTTRHGAGPLAHDGDDMSYIEINDPTNVHNDWQGTIRAAPLDLDVLAQAIRWDISLAERVSLKANLAMSCRDQVKNCIVFYAEGRKRESRWHEFVKFVRDSADIGLHYVGAGPNRTAVSNAGS